jgi:hypothetical protein
MTLAPQSTHKAFGWSLPFDVLWPFSLESLQEGDRLLQFQEDLNDEIIN